jgi:copper chaperone CopZ
MAKTCSELFHWVDGLVDGELTPEEAREVERHLEACPPCRSERDSRAALKRALSELRRPASPRRFTVADLRPLHVWKWTGAAAAVLVMALVLFSLPAPLPEVVALSVRLHDDYVNGRLAPGHLEGLTPHELGLKVSVPGTDYVGDCTCCRELGVASPFIVYRKGGVPITLLVVEGEPRPLPPSARRTREGREFHSFRAGKDHAVVCQSGKICHIWVSRLEEAELVRTILATPEARQLFGGDRLTLEGITCRACCSIIEARARGVKGVKDAAVDIEKMELVVTSDGGKIDLDTVIRAIRDAGYGVREKR